MTNLLQNAWEFFLAAMLLLIVAQFLKNYRRFKSVRIVLWGAGFLLSLIALFFFRDPYREAPREQHVVVAPADGKIILIEPLATLEGEKEPFQCVSIFMSLLDVHINRIPIKGVVTEKRERLGQFYAANTEKARHHNAAKLIKLNTDAGTVGIRQLTGLTTRRIVCRPEIGDSVKLGQRYGLIKLGSCVQLYLSGKVKLDIKKGQHVKGGESIIGRY